MEREREKVYVSMVVDDGLFELWMRLARKTFALLLLYYIIAFMHRIVSLSLFFFFFASQMSSAVSALL